MTTIAPQNSSKVFEHFENPNLIVVEDVHIFKLLKKKIDIDVSCKFQDVWALKMPWAKLIFNEVRLVSSIKCHVCSIIEKKYKVLVAKWDSTEKHAGKKKVPSYQHVHQHVTTANFLNFGL